MQRWMQHWTEQRNKLGDVRGYNSIDYFLDLFLKIIDLSFINFNTILKIYIIINFKTCKIN